MEIHCLSFGVIAVFATPRLRRELIIGIEGTIARDKLDRFVGAKQSLQTIKLIEQIWIDGLNFIRAKSRKKWLSLANSS
jgi:hypothetical protein